MQASSRHYLSTLQTNYKPSKSAGTRLENIPHVVDLAAFPAPYLYPLNTGLTSDDGVRQTASMPKLSPLRTMAFSTPKSSVNSVLRAGRRTRWYATTPPFMVLFTFGCRSSSRTLKTSMGHSSTANDSVQRVSRTLKSDDIAVCIHFLPTWENLFLIDSVR